MPERSQYSFWGAIRVFSLAVALISCGLGIRLGWDSADPAYVLAVLLLLGGTLAQAGINLVNDTEDLRQHKAVRVSAQAEKRIIRNARFGWAAFALASLIGLYLVSLRGWPLLLIFILSGMLALNYHSGPFNFKRNGYAIIQVFVLMGVIMVEASYFTMTGRFSMQVLLLSLPVGLLISLLLLSNEIRDYESDLQDQTRTLSVRIGLPAARLSYWALIGAAFIMTAAYTYSGWITSGELIWLAPALLMLPILKKYLYAEDRSQLTPLSGLFFLVFGLAYLYMVSA